MDAEKKIKFLIKLNFFSLDQSMRKLMIWSIHWLRTSFGTFSLAHFDCAQHWRKRLIKFTWRNLHFRWQWTILTRKVFWHWEIDERSFTLLWSTIFSTWSLQMNNHTKTFNFSLSLSLHLLDRLCSSRLSIELNMYIRKKATFAISSYSHSNSLWSNVFSSIHWDVFLTSEINTQSHPIHYRLSFQTNQWILMIILNFEWEEKVNWMKRIVRFNGIRR